MHKLKLAIANLKGAAAAGYVATAEWFKARSVFFASLVNALTVVAFVVGVIALLSLMWLYVRPIKLADIKVPVATDQASYYPGEEISGIFFGEIYHRGEVRVLREVFCKNYHDVIQPPETARNGDFYDTQSIPRKLEGLNVNIGLLPKNVPVGSNCVLQFTNVYNLQTPFGVRHIEYQYYTQNFSIVTRERRQQLECESSGRKDCNFLSDEGARETAAQDDEIPSQQSSPDSEPAPDTFNDNRSTTNNTVNNPPADQEPAPRFEERCTVDFLIKINCRQVPVN